MGGEDLAYIHRFVDAMYSKLLSWHRYLATKRDPEGSGLVTIYHPWESGTDNSPRWDEALDAVPVGEVPHYRRGDLQHVDDAAERPTDLEYDRYLWLVELVKRARYDEAEIYFAHPFLVKDVLFSAILVAANEALLEIADFVDARDDERAEISAWTTTSAGTHRCASERPLVSPRSSLALSTLPDWRRFSARFGQKIFSVIRSCDGPCRRPRARESPASIPAATGAVRCGPSSTGSCGGRWSGPESAVSPRISGRNLCINLPAVDSPNISIP
jgi:hypothetical protein